VQSQTKLRAASPAAVSGRYRLDCRVLAFMLLFIFIPPSIGPQNVLQESQTASAIPDPALRGGAGKRLRPALLAQTLK
jgi:hypothetical protein